jgi:hypothetical protein
MAALQYVIFFVTIIGFSVPGFAAEIAGLGSLGVSNFETYSWAYGASGDSCLLYTSDAADE